MIDAGIVAPPKKWVDSGHVMVPICELQPPFREAGHVERLEQSLREGRGR